MVEKEEVVVVVMVIDVRESKHAMDRGRAARRGRETVGLVIVHIANRDRDAGWVGAVVCGGLWPVLAGVLPLAETRWDGRQSRGVRRELESGNRPRSSERGTARGESGLAQRRGLGVVGWHGGGVYGE